MKDLQERINELGMQYPDSIIHPPVLAYIETIDVKTGETNIMLYDHLSAEEMVRKYELSLIEEKQATIKAKLKSEKDIFNLKNKI